jgi:hypothetical protein
MQKKFILLIIGLLGLAGFILILIGTKWGIGASPDSVVYINGARNLLLGNGFGVSTFEGDAFPITHHAPFYSILLSTIGFTGIDPLVGARWLNAILFIANIFIIGFIIYLQHPDLIALPIFGALIILLSPMMLSVHLMAWTEATFIFLSLLGFIFLAKFLNNFRWLFLVVSAVLFGFSILTRYAGLSLVATGALGVFLFGSKPLRKRLFDSAVFLIISLLPFVLWTIRNMANAGTATSREFSFHLISRSHLWQAVYTVSGWFLVPNSAPNFILIVVPFLVITLIIVVGLLVLKKQDSIKHFFLPNTPSFSKNLVFLLALFIFVYLGFLVVSISTLDANTPLNDRILSPIFVAGIIIAAYIIGDYWKSTPQKNVLHILIPILSLALLVGYTFQNVRLISDAYTNGLGYNQRVWHESSTINYIQTLSSGIPIYSNASEGIYLHTERPTYRIPSKFDSVNNQENVNFKNQIAEMQNQLENGKGIIVFFHGPVRPNIPSVEELSQLFPIYLLAQKSDGTIYTLEKNE